jgi:hypothetical protein
MHSPHTSVSVFGLEDPPVCPIAVQLAVEDPLLVGVPLEPLGIISGAHQRVELRGGDHAWVPAHSRPHRGNQPQHTRPMAAAYPVPASPASADYRGGCVGDRSYRSGTVKSAVRR